MPGGIGKILRVAPLDLKLPLSQQQKGVERHLLTQSDVPKGRSSRKFTEVTPEGADIPYGSDNWRPPGSNGRASWSMPEVDWDAPSGISARSLHNPDGHSGSMTVPLPENPTWRDIYNAIDSTLHPDSDHVFIEGLHLSDDGVLHFKTGS